MKFPGVKRLGHEVVGSSLHALDDVLFLRSGGEKNCVDVAVLPVMSNAAYQFQAIQPWHHPVADHNRKRRVLKSSPSLVSIWSGEHVMPPIYRASCGALCAIWASAITTLMIDLRWQVVS